MLISLPMTLSLNSIKFILIMPALFQDVLGDGVKSPSGAVLRGLMGKRDLEQEVQEAGPQAPPLRSRTVHASMVGIWSPFPKGLRKATCRHSFLSLLH